MLVPNRYKRLNHQLMILIAGISKSELSTKVYQYTENSMYWYTYNLKKVYI